MRAQRGKFHWRVISALAVDLRTPRKRRKCCPECGKVQFRHILIELFRDNVRAEENGVPQATYHTRLCSQSWQRRVEREGLKSRRLGNVCSSLALERSVKIAISPLSHRALSAMRADQNHQRRKRKPCPHEEPKTTIAEIKARTGMDLRIQTRASHSIEHGSFS